MAIGPLMLDVAGLELTSAERNWLQNPLVGGLILFSRNYQSANQVAELCHAIREASDDILIAVDHEGGRVQRFREEFSAVPPMGSLLANSDTIEQAQDLAYRWGAMIALEVQSVGIDFSFAPVLDLDRKISQVIGDRGFSGDVDEVIAIGQSCIRGMTDHGMATTAKHFPGHGSVEADSHIAIPVDERERETIITQDMRVFEALAQDYQAVMPAHVIYPSVDSQPAGFSEIWLQEFLRQQCQFDGVIFSDDLSMKGAEVVGGYDARAEAAISAGCDMVLVCNHPQEGQALLNSYNLPQSNASKARLARMKGQQLNYSLANLKQSDVWLKQASALKLV